MVDEEVAADLRAGMDVDRGQEARQMIDQPREEIEPPAVQPVRDAVERQRPDAGIEQHLPARPRRRVARLDRVEIGKQRRSASPASLPFVDANLGARRREMPAERARAERRDRLAARSRLRHSIATATGWRAPFSSNSWPTRRALLPFIADRLRRAAGRRRAGHGVRPDLEHPADQHGRSARRRLGRRPHRRDLHHRASRAISHVAHRNVDWRLFLRIVIPGVIGGVARRLSC